MENKCLKSYTTVSGKEKKDTKLEKLERSQMHKMMWYAPPQHLARNPLSFK